MSSFSNSKPDSKKTPIGVGEKDVPCPFCRGTETELYSLFGGTLSTSQYYCRTCRVAFERFKWNSDTVKKSESDNT